MVTAVAPTISQVAMRAVRDEVDTDRVCPQSLVDGLVEQHGVAASHIHRAITVKRHAPDLIETVVAGEISLFAAHEQASARRKAADTVDRTPHGRAERTETLRRMAEEGYSEADIAARTGYTLGTVQQMLNQHGYRSMARRLGIRRKLDDDRIMDRLILSAEPSIEAINTIDWKSLDPDKVIVWEARLSAAIREWTHLRNQLRRVTHE